MASVLNLNNEVVKMRKEVKKIRVLTIRKLTRHLAKLKSKKGTQEDVLRNQRRAERLLEEIHAMKEVKPDDVTKTALQKEINFEKVCKMPGNTAEERAIARLGTHPQFKKKIDCIKAAVKAFKDERINPATTVRPLIDSGSNKDLEQVQRDVMLPELTEKKAANSLKQKPLLCKEGKKKNTKQCLKSVSRESASDVISQIEGNNALAIPKENIASVSKDIVPIFPKENMPASPKQDMPAVPKQDAPAALKQDTAITTKVEVPESSSKDSSALSISAVPKQDLPTDTAKDVPAAPTEATSAFPEIGDRSTEGASLASRASVCVPGFPQPFAGKEVVSPQINEETEKAMHSISSDIEESDKEDREYFDDSTEERFHKQSSGPDDSDSEDDFFIGKVKQAKRRKGCNVPSAIKSRAEEHHAAVVKEPTARPKTEMSSGAGNQNNKAQKLESVFCRSLAPSKHKPKVTKRNFKEEPHVNKKTAFPQMKPQVMKQQLDKKLTAKKESKNQQLHIEKRENKKQELQQPLHPSWEASKKRKEQQCLITAFQGKKIRFDD